MPQYIIEAFLHNTKKNKFFLLVQFYGFTQKGKLCFMVAYPFDQFQLKGDGLLYAFIGNIVGIKAAAEVAQVEYRFGYKLVSIFHFMLRRIGKVPQFRKGEDR